MRWNEVGRFGFDLQAAKRQNEAHGRTVRRWKADKQLLTGTESSIERHRQASW